MEQGARLHYTTRSNEQGNNRIYIIQNTTTSFCWICSRYCRNSKANYSIINQSVLKCQICVHVYFRKGRNKAPFTSRFMMKSILSSTFLTQVLKRTLYKNPYQAYIQWWIKKNKNCEDKRLINNIFYKKMLFTKYII